MFHTNSQLFLIILNTQDLWAPEPSCDHSQASCSPRKAVGGDSAPLLTSRLLCNISLSQSTQSLLWEEEGARLRRSRWTAEPGQVCQGTLQARPTDTVSQASVPHSSCGNSWSVLYIHRFYYSKETTLARCTDITTVLSPRKSGLLPFPSTNIGHVSDFPLLGKQRSYPEGI